MEEKNASKNWSRADLFVHCSQIYESLWRSSSLVNAIKRTLIYIPVFFKSEQISAFATFSLHDDRPRHFILSIYRKSAKWIYKDHECIWTSAYAILYPAFLS